MHQPPASSQQWQPGTAGPFPPDWWIIGGFLGSFEIWWTGAEWKFQRPRGDWPRFQTHQLEPELRKAGKMLQTPENLGKYTSVFPVLCSSAKQGGVCG